MHTVLKHTNTPIIGVNYEQFKLIQSFKFNKLTITTAVVTRSDLE